MLDRTPLPDKPYTGGKRPDPERCYRCYVPSCGRRCKASQVMCWSHWMRLRNKTRAGIYKALEAPIPPDQPGRDARTRAIVALVQKAVVELTERGRLIVTRRDEPWHRDDKGRHTGE